MEGQSQKAVEISDSMVQLSESSSQTAAFLREVNGTIAQLNETAQMLQNEILSFKLDEEH